MIKQKYFVPTNQYQQEQLTRGNLLFPLTSYHRDVHEYFGQEIIPHWHPELELFFLDEGNIQLTLAVNSYQIKPGEGFLINTNGLHGIKCLSSAPCRYRSLVFDSTIVAGQLNSAFDLLYIRPLLESGIPAWIFTKKKPTLTAQCRTLFDQAYFSEQTKKSGYEFQIRAALSQILFQAKQSAKSVRSATTKTERTLQKLLLWIDHHYHEPITSKQLAASANLSVRECQRYFASTLHTSPSKYIIHHRILAAARLLLTTDYSVTEISSRCGFNSPSYFTKTFRAAMNVSPLQFRNQHL